ncbi:MAG: hypothetical protein RIA08_21170 [Roseovarius sp.]|uniref:hypothetical protein n=1 Tax=Rhodobacterales TaxID=204455 RepID=UPI0007CF7065|nr:MULTISPECIES: hypothetical protein [Rhodobacterales]KZY42252.1 hypothetical protein A3731_11425 [Roseovarius sp. HI0049]MCR8549983.1 hypothetical protein [Salipiger pentaromativorans]
MRTALLCISITVVGFSAAAERDLVPSLDGTSDVCIDRPAEPEWMQNITVREAFKRVLVQDIYRAQNLERIVETGSCSCDTRFPSWGAAETEFRDRFATTERWEMLEASDTYNRRANALRPDAMAICEAEGNW